MIKESVEKLQRQPLADDTGSIGTNVEQCIHLPYYR